MLKYVYFGYHSRIILLSSLVSLLLVLLHYIHNRYHTLSLIILLIYNNKKNYENRQVFVCNYKVERSTLILFAIQIFHNRNDMAYHLLTKCPVTTQKEVSTDHNLYSYNHHINTTSIIMLNNKRQKGICHLDLWNKIIGRVEEETDGRIFLVVFET